MKPKTHVLIILDKSGSMASCRDAALQGFNEKLQQYKDESSEQDILVSLYTFNHSVYEHVLEGNPNELAELTVEDYTPSGSTAMLDAVGYAVTKLRDDTKGEKGNVAFLVEIISDGEENASRKYNWESVAEIIQSCQATGKWTFGYIGSNQDLSSLARRIGIPKANMAAIQTHSLASAHGGFTASNNAGSEYLKGRSFGRMSSHALYNSTDAVADFTADRIWNAAQDRPHLNKKSDVNAKRLTGRLVKLSD